MKEDFKNLLAVIIGGPVSFFVLIVLMVGCSNKMIIPSTEVIDSAGETITTTAQTVGDTSAYRTHEKYSAWKIGYKEFYTAFKASGTRIDGWEEVKIDDNHSYFLPKISVTPIPTFISPDDLKDHPVWEFGKTFIRTTIPWLTGAWMFDSAMGTFESIATRPSYVFQGDSTMLGSMNTAGAEQSILLQDNPFFSSDFEKEMSGLEAIE
jgi:hypothetical protein